jgi:hypothetical protein
MSQQAESASFFIRNPAQSVKNVLYENTGSVEKTRTDRSYNEKKIRQYMKKQHSPLKI